MKSTMILQKDVKRLELRQFSLPELHKMFVHIMYTRLMAKVNSLVSQYLPSHPTAQAQMTSWPRESRHVAPFRQGEGSHRFGAITS